MAAYLPRTAKLNMAKACPDLPSRLSNYLAAQVRGPSRYKRLARRLSITERTARHYLSGVWPGARAWRSIVREFGEEVLTVVFGPEIDEERARLVCEVRALEAELDDRRAALRVRARNQEGVASAARQAA